MKKNKGFTLAELLAGILILGMIALIGVPATSKVIKKSRERSYKTTINYIITAIKNNCKREQIEADELTNNYTFTKDGVFPKIKVKGKLPTSGNVEVDDNCKITSLSLSNNKYLAHYNNGNIEVVDGRQVYKPGDIVYFDPISEEPCTSNTFSVQNINNESSSCYKWRVISTDDTNKNKNIDIQLDHSIVTSVWASSNYPSYGPNTALPELDKKTNSWIRVPYLNYYYDSYLATDSNLKYKLSCINGTCDIGSKTSNNIRTRIISAEEIVKIINYNITDPTKKLKWNVKSSDFFNIPSDLYWLIENSSTLEENSKGSENVYVSLNGNQCYWTLSPTSYTCGSYSSRHCVVLVCQSGRITYEDANDTSNGYYTLRPVINISKELISK